MKRSFHSSLKKWFMLTLAYKLRGYLQRISSRDKNLCVALDDWIKAQKSDIKEIKDENITDR